MKREIKFRGKRLDTGEWIVGDRLENQGRLFIYQATSETTIQVNDDGRISLVAIEVDPATVGQFTGLKDKNGRDIYEGDILSANGRVVGWVKGNVRGYCYDVVYINHPAGEERWPLYSTVVHDYSGKIEITCNLHDNPELSKGDNL